MTMTRNIVFASTLLIPAVLQPAVAIAQTQTATVSAAAGTQSWTTEQILPLSVHSAWKLSNKDETTFVEMVKALAAISTVNRGLVLPDTEEAGKLMGKYVKRYGTADPDQLLFVVVDKAVVKTVAATGKPAVK